MLAYLFVAAFLPAIILGHAVVPCPGGLPTPTGLRINGCPASPCNVNQGDFVSYEVDFAASAASTTLTLGITSTVFDESRELPLPPEMSNVCNNLIVGSCPVTSGLALTKSGILPVSTDYHGGIPAQLRVAITNADSSTASCCLINLIIH